MKKKEFLSIQKNNPESRIGQRSYKEQKFRDELAKSLSTARKKGINTPISEKNIKLAEKNEEISRMKVEIKSKEDKLIELESWERQKNEELEQKQQEVSEHLTNPTKRVKQLKQEYLDSMDKLPALELEVDNFVNENKKFYDELYNILREIMSKKFYRIGWNDGEIHYYEYKLDEDKINVLNHFGLYDEVTNLIDNKSKIQYLSTIRYKYASRGYGGEILPIITDIATDEFPERDACLINCPPEEKKKFIETAKEVYPEAYKYRRLDETLMSTYMNALSPIIELVDKVYKSEDLSVVAKKQFALYVAQSGLFPYSKLDGSDNRNQVYGMGWLPGWCGRDFKGVTKYLDDYGLKYKKDFDDGEVKIRLSDDLEIPGHVDVLRVERYAKFTPNEKLVLDAGDMLPSKQQNETPIERNRNYRALNENTIALNENLLKNNLLQKADLVMVYRNNGTYEKMKDDLQKLVKHKYGGNIVCIALDRDYPSLTENEKSVLQRLFENYPCITDYTISQWTGVKTKLIEDVESKDKDVLKFLRQSSKLGEVCSKKGIKTVYIVDEHRSSYKHAYNFLLEHGGLCLDENGRIYVIEEAICSNQYSYCDDAHRFWKSLFPNQEVKFISGDIHFDDDENLVIADRHLNLEKLGKIKNRISFAGASFEPNGGYTDFVGGENEENLGINAEKIFD